MASKLYRLREFINPADGHSLIVDTSGGLALGALPGLEHFSKAVQPVLPLVDGLITSPGHARTLRTRTKTDAALLVRADWTNTARREDFVLPPETNHYLPLLEPADALDLGASGLVSHFLLGYEEKIEAACINNTVQLALNGALLGLPLLVDVHVSGPRVVLREKAIELGVSYALEGGADGVAIPWPGAESFKRILTMAAEVPIWLKPEALDAGAQVLVEALELGAAGLWLDERVFASADPAGLLRAFGALVHGAVKERAQ